MLMNRYIALAMSSTLTFKSSSSLIFGIEEAQSRMHPCIIITPSRRVAEERAESWTKISAQLLSFSTIPRIPRAWPSIFFSRESKSSLICCVKEETFMLISPFRGILYPPIVQSYYNNRILPLSSSFLCKVEPHGLKPMAPKCFVGRNPPKHTPLRSFEAS